MKVRVREKAGADIPEQQPWFGKHGLTGPSEQPINLGGGHPSRFTEVTEPEWHLGAPVHLSDNRFLSFSASHVVISGATFLFRRHKRPRWAPVPGTRVSVPFPLPPVKVLAYCAQGASIILRSAVFITRRQYLPMLLILLLKTSINPIELRHWNNGLNPIVRQGGFSSILLLTITW